MKDGMTDKEKQESSNKLGELLVDLITNQDHVAQKWIEFLITIEAGLAVALGFLLRSVADINSQQQVISNAALYLIPAIGILVALALTGIVVRERKWQSWYVARFNDIDCFKSKVFPDDNKSVDPQSNSNTSLISYIYGIVKIFREDDNSVGSQPEGNISRIVVVLAISISLAWVIVLFVLLFG